MKQTRQRRAMLMLWVCIGVLALCAAGMLALLLPVPKAEDVQIPGARGTIPATVQMPGKLARGAEMPLVVMCHGFTGNRAGDGHFEPLARDLAEQGIASVRLDFAGCGDSAEPYTEYTLTNMAADVDAAIAWMQEQYNTRGPVALVGHSMGGRLASLYPKLGSYPAAALALWSPANGTGLHGLEFLNINDSSQVEALAAEAEANGQAGTKWGVEISAAFVQQMRDSDPNAALREAGIPVLLTYSGQDTVLSEQTISETIATVESLPDSQVVLDPFVEGDHNYTAEDAALSAQLDAALREATATFLSNALK